MFFFLKKSIMATISYTDVTENLFLKAFLKASIAGIKVDV